MNKMTFAAAVVCFSFSHASYSEEMSGHWMVCGIVCGCQRGQFRTG